MVGDRGSRVTSRGSRVNGRGSNNPPQLFLNVVKSKFRVYSSFRCLFYFHVNTFSSSVTSIEREAGMELPAVWHIFEIKTHSFEFTKHVSDEQHPSSVANTNEPLVGMI